MLDGIVKDVISERETQKKEDIVPVFEEKSAENAENSLEEISLPIEEKPKEVIEEPKEIEENSSIRIKVIGIGGAGCNSVSRITKQGIKSAKTLAVNTDRLHLGVIEAHEKHLLGRTVTKGLGSGGDPSVAAKAADADRATLRKLIGENEIVFVCAGMGGGTGTGASPLIAQLAREQGATVIGVVTYPFRIERSRLHRARDGLKELMKHADTVIVIENDRLLSYAPNLPIDKAFALADEIASRAVRGISDLVVLPSMMNVDYADVRAIMKDGGIAMISIGKASGTGPGMVENLVNSTRNNPLLEVNYEGAKGALIHVAGAGGLTLGDATQICMGISNDFHEDAEVKMGARIDEGLTNAIEVTAVITGVKAPHLFEDQKPQEEMQGEMLSSIL